MLSLIWAISINVRLLICSIAECLSLDNIPDGKWFCRTCHNTWLKEKFIKHNVNAVAAGRVEGVDAFEQIRQRCILIVKNQADDAGGCALCRCVYGGVCFFYLMLNITFFELNVE